MHKAAIILIAARIDQLAHEVYDGKFEPNGNELPHKKKLREEMGALYKSNLHLITEDWRSNRRSA